MDEEQEPIAVPLCELSQAALRGVVEAFVLREGTDYGAREYTLDEKIGHVMGQLERGEAVIVYDPATETVHIVQREATSHAADEADPVA